jgi:cell wall-associated NlpC family hydrolase
MKFELMISVGMSLLNIPYKWGGSNNHDGYDCSGFIQELLSCIGKDPKGDQDAQSLYNYLSISEEWEKKLDRGSILFFGKDIKDITHVAIALSNDLMLECGGGDRTTLSLIDALKKGAKVRVRPIRKDLIAYVRLK